MSDSAVLTLVNSSRRQNNGSEGQFHHLELDAGCNMKQLEVPEEGGHLKTRRAGYTAVDLSQRLGVQPRASCSNLGRE